MSTSPSTSRSIRLAALCLLATLAFGITLCLLTPSLSKLLNARDGRGYGVSYTFDHQQCVGGTSSFSRCTWRGTVTNDSNQVVGTNVIFRDAAPSDVQVGTTVDALWSDRDPNSAFDLSASRAWLNTLYSAIVSTICFAVLLVMFGYWARRALRDIRRDRLAPPASTPSAHKNPAGRDESKPKPKATVEKTPTV